MHGNHRINRECKELIEIVIQPMENYSAHRADF